MENGPATAQKGHGETLPNKAGAPVEQKTGLGEKITLHQAEEIGDSAIRSNERAGKLSKFSKVKQMFLGSEATDQIADVKLIAGTAEAPALDTPDGRLNDAVQRLATEAGRERKGVVLGIGTSESAIREEVTALLSSEDLSQVELSSVNEAMTTLDANLQKAREAAIEKGDKNLGGDYAEYTEKIKYEHDLDKMIMDLPEGVLQKMWSSPNQAENSFIHGAAKKIIEASSQTEYGLMLGSASPRTLERLVKADGFSDMDHFWKVVRVARKHGDPMPGGDKLAPVINHPEVLLKSDKRDVLTTLTGPEQRREAQNFIGDYLESVGFDSSTAADMTHAMRGRTTKDFNDQDSTLSWNKITTELSDLTERVNALGLESIGKLRDEAGILNFATIPLNQLENTLGIIDGDQSVIDRMNSEESSIMFRDATEDWNGAFEASADKIFVGGKNSNAVFEISSLADNGAELQKYISLLEKTGVTPTTLALAGHGSPGSIRFGNGNLVHGGEGKDTELSMQSGTLQRLFKTLRPDVSGRSHVYLKSCSQASKNTWDSVSSAERIAQAAAAVNEQPVDVYAAEAPTNTKRDEYDSSLSLGNGNDIVIVTVDDEGHPVSRSQKQVTLPAFYKVNLNKRPQPRPVVAEGVDLRE